ncbi:MAG: hypothetical protein JSS69_10195 [Acidobacteria bacterium]|nr:hypothetical protein [Acidobacteriota bacterium]MBS1866274.1 hypothetical protein [Acidobacteriota bacterium]
MTDQPPVQDERFKAEMPQIPGVGPGGRRPGGMAAPLKIVGGLAAVIAVVVLVGSLVSRSKRNAPPPADPLQQVEVPAPDLGNPPSQAAQATKGIASIEQMSKPWASTQFDFKDPLTGERIPSLLLRLPAGAASQPAGYWALSLKAPYGNCQLELVSDLEKLKSDYGFRAARHPMIGNPCSRTVFDPEKMANLPGNVWVRGAIVQGSDLRPPLGIEIKIEGKDIFAVRMEL